MIRYTISDSDDQKIDLSLLLCIAICCYVVPIYGDKFGPVKRLRYMTSRLIGDISTKGVDHLCTNAVLQQDKLHDVADLLEVHLGNHHVDGVGGNKDDGEESEANDVTSHRAPALSLIHISEPTRPD